MKIIVTATYDENRGKKVRVEIVEAGVIIASYERGSYPGREDPTTADAAWGALADLKRKLKKAHEEMIRQGFVPPTMKLEDIE